MLFKRFSILAFALAIALTGAFGQTTCTQPSPTLIQYNSCDYTTLVYVDANSTPRTVSYLDSDNFSKLLTIRGQQLQAALDNANAVKTYNGIVANDQISVSAGRGDSIPPLPAKPQQKVVANDGTVTMVDFPAGTLTALVYPATTPSAGIVDTTNRPPDPTAQMAVIIQQLSAVLANQNAIIAALKAKGLM